MADTPLDNLYRDKTSSGLKDTLPGTVEIREATDDGQTVRVNVDWSHSHMRIDCTPTTVNFLRLDSGRKGLYGDLCDKLPKFFKARGVKEFTMTPEDADSAAVLSKRGKWALDGNRYRWGL